VDYVSFVGDAIYFGEEGNHRTCIARFFFHAEGLTTIHGVRLGNYMIDWTFKDLFDKISFYIGTRGLPVSFPAKQDGGKKRSGKLENGQIPDCSHGEKIQEGI